jgi:opacity protein-like surface antigen
VVRAFLGYAVTRPIGIEIGVNAFEGGSGAIDLSALGSMPLSERVALYGRLGALAGDRGGTSLLLGAGLQFNLGESWALRVEWQHFESGNGADVLSLGIMGRF